MYGIRRNPMRHMEVIGYDHSGRPIVGATPQQAGPGVTHLTTNPLGPVIATFQPSAAPLYGGATVMMPPPTTYGPSDGSTTVPASPQLAAPAVPNPGWRQGQLAPGVESAQEGMVPLPMAALQGSPAGTFSATVTAITFQGQLQKPFRGERILIARVNTGTSATGLVLAQIFVGVDLQMGDITPIPIESLANGNAFGTRLTLMQAPPGVLIRIPCTLSSNPTSTDTVFISMMILGRIIH